MLVQSMLLRHCSWEPSLVHGPSTGGEGVWVSPYLNVSTGQAPCYWSTLQEGWSLLPWAAQQWCLQIDQFHDQVCEKKNITEMQTFLLITLTLVPSLSHTQLVREGGGVYGKLEMRLGSRLTHTWSVFVPQVQMQLLPPSLPLQHSLQTKKKKLNYIHLILSVHF